MEFYSYYTTYKAASNVARLNGMQMPDKKTFFARLAVAELESGNAATNMNRAAAEEFWERQSKPYYNMWPKIVPSLASFRMSDVSASNAEPPLPTLLVRFAKGSGTLPIADERGGRHELRSILICNGKVEFEISDAGKMQKQGKEVGRNMLSMYMDWGEENKEYRGAGAMPCFFIRSFFVDHPGSVEDAIAELDHDWTCLGGWPHDKEATDSAIRICVALAMIARHPDDDIIRPVVLADDRSKWEQSRDEKYVEKAKRRGNVGWDVGREIHISPHWRRPHPALYHVGKGRTEQRIVFRKGALVKRDVLGKVPTGYLADEEA